MMTIQLHAKGTLARLAFTSTSRLFRPFTGHLDTPPTENSRPQVHRAFGFCRPLAFFFGMDIPAHGAMAMLHVRVGCRDKPAE